MLLGVGGKRGPPVSDSEDSSEEVPFTGALKLESQTCEVCSKTGSKYRCPGCDILFCSLNCSKEHKSKSGCSGQRNRTKFVPLDEFDDKKLVKDYRFLEETFRVTDSSKVFDYVIRRTNTNHPQRRRVTTKGLNTNAKNLPSHLRALVWQCRHRGITMEIMPVHMTRRKTNTTQYNTKQKKVLWRVEWVFGEVRLADARADEDKTLQELLVGHLEVRPGNVATRHKLKEFLAVEASKYTLFFEEPKSQIDQKRYVKLDASSSIRDALKGKVVVEYPEIHVCLPGREEEYPVVEEEDETSGESEGSESGDSSGDSEEKDDKDGQDSDRDSEEPKEQPKDIISVLAEAVTKDAQNKPNE